MSLTSRATAIRVALGARIGRQPSHPVRHRRCSVQMYRQQPISLVALRDRASERQMERMSPVLLTRTGTQRCSGRGAILPVHVLFSDDSQSKSLVPAKRETCMSCRLVAHLRTPLIFQSRRSSSTGTIFLSSKVRLSILDPRSDLTIRSILYPGPDSSA